MSADSRHTDKIPLTSSVRRTRTNKQADTSKYIISLLCGKKSDRLVGPFFGMTPIEECNF